MLNVVFEDEYSLYRSGMEWLLAELFEQEVNDGAQFNILSRDNVADADIIVKKFVAGEDALCQPLLKARKKNSLLIGIHEGSSPVPNANLPFCLSHSVFIHRAESLSCIKERILHGWEQCSLQTFYPRVTNCFECKHKTLTPQQISVAAHFYLGEATLLTAQRMNISSKTVSSHKYSIMSKFNLKTDQDLWDLLRLFKEQMSVSTAFSECLKTCF